MPLPAAVTAVAKQRKSPQQRRAEARLRFVAVLLRNGGTAAVERYVVAERRDLIARQRAQREVAAQVVVPAQLELLAPAPLYHPRPPTQEQDVTAPDPARPDRERASA